MKQFYEEELRRKQGAHGGASASGYSSSEIGSYRSNQSYEYEYEVDDENEEAEEEEEEEQDEEGEEDEDEDDLQFENLEDEQDDDDDENRLRVLPRLTKVKAFKVTRSRSLNHFSLAPTILRRVGEPEVPQTDSTTNTKEIHKPYIKNTIDDHNAEPPTSDMTSSVDHSLPNYYLNSAPSGINGTLFSSSAPNSTAKEAPTTSNDAKVTKSRNSTVIFTKKRSTDSDFHLNEISPISNEGTSRLMKGVFDKVIKEEDENTQNTMRSTRSHSQSTVLHPSFSGRITKSIFHEELQDTLKKGDVTISKNSSSSSDDKKASPPGSSASSKLKQPFFDRKRSFAVFIVLVGLYCKSTLPTTSSVIADDLACL